MSMTVDPHTHDRECPRCPGPHGGAGPCDQYSYSRGWLRFVGAHHLAYAAILYGDAGPSRAELDRLRREWATMPPRHVCSCNPHHCRECAALVLSCERCKALPLLSRPKQCGSCERLQATPSKVEIGRTSPVHAPSPPADLVDVVVGYAAASVRRAA